MKWLLITLSILANILSNITLKFAAITPNKFSTWSGFCQLLTSSTFWLSFTVYFLSFFVYGTALKRVPLNIAYPIVNSGVLIGICALATIIFHEPFYMATGLGVALILAGLVLITWKLPQ